MGENRGRNGEKSRDSVLNRFLRSEGRSEGVGGWNWLLTGWKRTRSISCAFWPVDARERVAISRRLFFSGRGRKGVEVGDPLETVENLIDRKRGWDIGWKIGFDRWPRTNAPLLTHPGFNFISVTEFFLLLLSFEEWSLPISLRSYPSWRLN